MISSFLLSSKTSGLDGTLDSNLKFQERLLAFQLIFISMEIMKNKAFDKTSFTTLSKINTLMEISSIRGALTMSTEGWGSKQNKELTFRSQCHSNNYL